MSISPARAFTLGVCSVIALAGSFAAGIVVGNTPVVTTTEYLRAADDPLPPAPTDDCPAMPGPNATRSELDQHALCRLEIEAEILLIRRGAVFADVDATYVDNATLLGPERRTALSVRVTAPSPWSSQETIAGLAAQLGVAPTDIDLLHEQSSLPEVARSVPPRTTGR